jgi:hypothetical protein
VNEYRSFLKTETFITYPSYVNRLSPPMIKEVSVLGHTFMFLTKSYPPLSLRELMKEKNLRPYHEFEIAWVVAWTLCKIHKAGFAHQHVNPSNVLFG